MQFLLIGLGGGIGAVTRFLVGRTVQRLLQSPSFPWGTVLVNVSGCLVIGFLAGLHEQRQIFSANARCFVFIGCLGGYTTFSTFGYETLALARDGETLLALGNVALQVVPGLFAVWLGATAARLL